MEKGMWASRILVDTSTSQGRNYHIVQTSFGKWSLFPCSMCLDMSTAKNAWEIPEKCTKTPRPTKI
jgi:hypothetical protein